MAASHGARSNASSVRFDASLGCRTERGDGPPGATQEKSITQLMIYALAVARTSTRRFFSQAA